MNRGHAIAPAAQPALTEAADANFPAAAQGYYVLAVLIPAYTVSYIDRTMLTLLVDPIRATLQISDVQISLLHGFAFAIFYTVLGVLMGHIADRYSRRNLIIGASFSGALPRRCVVSRETSGRCLLPV